MKVLARSCERWASSAPEQSLASLDPAAQLAKMVDGDWAGAGVTLRGNDYRSPQP